MQKQIIFVADDFGMSAEINEAILHSHLSGKLQATALMMGQTGTEEAVVIAHDNPALQIGWHVHLNDSIPATLQQWPWGKSPAWAGLSVSFSRQSREIMRREIARQWELFQSTGLSCHFVNCHHHLQAHPLIHQTLREVLGPDFKGWIRLGEVRYFLPEPSFLSTSHLLNFFLKRERKLSTWHSPDTLWGLDRLCSMKAQEVRSVISNLPEGLHEFLFHPRTLSCPDTQCLLELKSPPLQND